MGRQGQAEIERVDPLKAAQQPQHLCGAGMIEQVVGIDHERVHIPRVERERFL